MKRDYLVELLKTDKTVFTFKDVSLLWGETDRDFIKKKIYRYLKAGKIFSVRKGIYSKEKTYDKYELAVKIYTPAYLSFETVLGMAGVTFQLYSQIFIASYLTREIECDGQKYSFCRIREDILNNSIGLEIRENYSIASPERAFLDIIYRHKDYHFDNLAPLNWDKVDELLLAYGGSHRMSKAVQKYHLDFIKELK